MNQNGIIWTFGYNTYNAWYERSKIPWKGNKLLKAAMLKNIAYYGHQKK